MNGPMIKPEKLQRGDKVAAISLSWGGAGAIPHRYEIGKQQLEETFGVTVVPTKHALRSADWIYKNPAARAADLMEALADTTIKGIISTIGGDDSIRTLPYMDVATIRDNPKVFLGFSDTTITHFCFYKAGVTSFYGTSLMTGFAENGGMHEYQIKDIQKTLFDNQPIGLITPNKAGWTSEMLDWNEAENQSIIRTLQPANSWTFLQGTGSTQGQLLGGCFEILDFLKDTPFWVPSKEWKDKILFLETSEMKIKPDNFKWALRNYAASGILHQIAGLLVARPYDNLYKEAYDKALLTVIREEEGLSQLPIITGMDFGHTSPIFTLPYGVLAEINCEQQTFSILENACR